jgi:hypothetical protein
MNWKGIWIESERVLYLGILISDWSQLQLLCGNIVLALPKLSKFLFAHQI